MVTASGRRPPDMHAQLLIQALRLADPDTVVGLDRSNGQLKVSTRLGQDHVLAILEGLGIEVSSARGVTRVGDVDGCRDGRD